MILMIVSTPIHLLHLRVNLPLVSQRDFFRFCSLIKTFTREKFAACRVFEDKPLARISPICSFDHRVLNPYLIVRILLMTRAFWGMNVSQWDAMVRSKIVACSRGID